MLTQEQKDQLEPLTHHPKYGKLLQEAIKGWEKVNPKTEKFGIYLDNGEFKLIVEDTPGMTGCCLVGSVMMNKKSDNEYITDSVINLFRQISENETSGLMSGFDCDEVLFKDEAYEFGKEINKILFT
jgi:hypothetical protein